MQITRQKEERLECNFNCKEKLISSIYATARSELAISETSVWYLVNDIYLVFIKCKNKCLEAVLLKT